MTTTERTAVTALLLGLGTTAAIASDWGPLVLAGAIVAGLAVARAAGRARKARP